MKVLIFSSDSKSLYMFRSNLMQHLMSKGFKVICYCSRDAFFEEARNLLSERGIELKQLNFFNAGKNPLKDLITLKEIYKVLKDEDPTHIFPYHIKPVIYVSLCCWLFSAIKIKIHPTITGLGYLFTSLKPSVRFFNKIICLLYKLAFKRSSTVFFQNKDDLSLFIEKNIVSIEKAILVGGSGIDLDDYPFCPHPNQLSFIFIGRLIADKGILEYLAACKLVKERYPHVSCRLIGSFTNNPAFIPREVIQEISQSSGVEYLGEVADIRPWLMNSTVFVFPSYYREGIPRAGLEALSMGRPVITTDVPGCREIVAEGINGYCIPAKNSNALANAMIKMIEHQDALTQMGKESRIMAEKRFNVNDISQIMFEAMNK